MRSEIKKYYEYLIYGFMALAIVNFLLLLLAKSYWFEIALLSITISSFCVLTFVGYKIDILEAKQSKRRQKK